MNRISEITNNLYKNQLLVACQVIAEGKMKISSVTMETDIFIIIRDVIPHGLVVKPYKIDDNFSLVVIAKDQEPIDLIEELNDLTTSKALKEHIYITLFGKI